MKTPERFKHQNIKKPIIYGSGWVVGRLRGVQKFVESKMISREEKTALYNSECAGFEYEQEWLHYNDLADLVSTPANEVGKFVYLKQKGMVPIHDKLTPNVGNYRMGGYLQIPDHIKGLKTIVK